MKARDGKTTPIWIEENSNKTEYPEPTSATHTEIVIVGGGIAGLTAGYLLAREGFEVILLDEGPIGSGQTQRTSAHLSSIIDDRFSHLEKLHGRDTARMAYQSHASAINQIEQIVRTEQIDCNFHRVDAYLFPASPMDADFINQEFDASQRAGAKVEHVSQVPDTTVNSPSLRFGNQAIFNPVQYLYGLADAATKHGLRIFTGRRVQDVQGVNPKSHEPAQITFYDNQQVITAHHVIVATNVPTPINDWMGVYLKQAAYRTYMVGLKIPAGSVPNALYWDTIDPYHYARILNQPKEGHDVLIVGGEDHRTGQKGSTDERFDKLIEWTRTIFPQVGEAVSRWSGQVVETGDGLGFIGRAPTKGENVYCITGDSGMGLTHGTLGAILITDLIAGRPNEWEKIYDPSRKLLNMDVITENANTTEQYVDYLTPGEIKDESDLKPGEGGLLRHGLKKIAIYRDDKGQLHKMSAVCPHLKGIVHWNAVEKSWDCPCHGSRFDCTGKLLVGPSYSDLEKSET